MRNWGEGNPFIPLIRCCVLEEAHRPQGVVVVPFYVFVCVLLLDREDAKMYSEKKKEE